MRSASQSANTRATSAAGLRPIVCNIPLPLCPLLPELCTMDGSDPAASSHCAQLASRRQAQDVRFYFLSIDTAQNALPHESVRSVSVGYPTIRPSTTLSERKDNTGLSSYTSLSNHPGANDS
jgi:hypothetical protein